MVILTVNIEDQGAERKIRALLDKLGLSYSINVDDARYNWWEDELLVQELDQRSQDLKFGRDKGISFAEVKQSLLSK